VRNDGARLIEPVQLEDAPAAEPLPAPDGDKAPDEPRLF
jgi:hypothetical protein